MDALQHHDNTSMSKTVLGKMISRFSVFIFLVTDEDLAWQIHGTEFSHSFHQKGMETVCSGGGGHRGWGTELVLLIILCHRFDFDGAKKLIYMLIFITKKMDEKENFGLILYARMSFIFASYLPLNIARDPMKH